MRSDSETVIVLGALIVVGGQDVPWREVEFGVAEEGVRGVCNPGVLWGEAALVSEGEGEPDEGEAVGRSMSIIVLA